MSTELIFGFSSLAQYVRTVFSPQGPKTIKRRTFLTKTVEEQQGHIEEQGGEMKRCLGPFDLVCIGVGLMLGAGVFVTTGDVAVNHSGYISAVFGEYLAWITVMNLVLEYILANAAVIRGFSPYFGMLINVAPDRLVTPYQNYQLDWFAFGLVLALTVLLILGTKESARFNLVVTIVHVVLVVFIIIAGFIKANPANLVPFAPKGARGIFNGAAVVFFSYIGFDAVATSAEEVKNPKRDLPMGILGALSVVTLCYILMSLALCLMVPTHALQEGGSFAAAFTYVGLDWARYIVALGALLGIITGTLVGMFAVSRIIAAVARQHLLPPVLSVVHPRFGTPWVSTLLSGVATAIIALFTDFAELINMVSISTLFAFWIVALALIWQRYFKVCSGSPQKIAILSLELFLLVTPCVAFTVVYWMAPEAWIGLVVCAVVFVGAMFALFFTFGKGSLPGSYAVPLFPFIPCLSIGLNTFLLGQLDKAAYERFGVWTAAVTAIYIFYSTHAAHVHSRNMPILPSKQNTLSSPLPSEVALSSATAKGLAPAGPDAVKA